MIATLSAMPFSWSSPDKTIETIDEWGLRPLTDAAKRADVNQFIHLAFSDNMDDFPLRNAKRAVEARSVARLRSVWRRQC